MKKNNKIYLASHLKVTMLTDFVKEINKMTVSIKIQKNMIVQNVLCAVCEGTHRRCVNRKPHNYKVLVFDIFDIKQNTWLLFICHL